MSVYCCSLSPSFSLNIRSKTDPLLTKKENAFFKVTNSKPIFGLSFELTRKTIFFFAAKNKNAPQNVCKVLQTTISDTEIENSKFPFPRTKIHLKSKKPKEKGSRFKIKTPLNSLTLESLAYGILDERRIWGAKIARKRNGGNFFHSRFFRNHRSASGPGDLSTILRIFLAFIASTKYDRNINHRLPTSLCK